MADTVVFSFGSPSFEFGNPWHDDIGRFAPKGSGSQFPEGTGKNFPHESQNSTGIDAAAVAGEVLDGKDVTVDGHDVDDVLLQFATSDKPIDMTRITVDGSDTMFSQMRDNGMPRDQMPQIPVEMLGDFQQKLRDAGIQFKPEVIDPQELKATQSELDGRKVGMIIRDLRAGEFDLSKDPLWVSNDGHVLDGHHRWAGAAAMSSDCGGCFNVPIIRVDVPMNQLLAFANNYNANAGIEKQGMNAPMPHELKRKQAAAIGDPEQPVYGMATDEADGITAEDLADLPHGDGSAFPPPSEEQMAIAKLRATVATSRLRWGVVMVEEFANPWHDEIGRFAPKGTGSKVGFDGDAASDLHDEAMATLAEHADEMDEAYKVHFESGEERSSTFSQARDEYLGYGSRELDAQLRKNGVDKIANPAHRRALTDAVVMDEAIERSGFVFEDDVTLLRGIRNTGNRQFTHGTTFTDNGFVSVTASPGEAAQASGQAVRPAGYPPEANPGTIVALRIPAGTKAMPGSDNEQEWVLPRGGTYTVTEVIESPGSRVAVVDVKFPDSPPVTPGIPTIEDMMGETAAQRERRGLAASPGENLVYERLSWDLGEVGVQATVLRRMFALIQHFANPWHDEIGRFAPKGTGTRAGTREIRRPGGMNIAVAEEPGGVTVGETGGGQVEVRTGANGLVEVNHDGEWMPEHRGKTRLANDGLDEAEIGAVIEAHRSSDSHRDAVDAMLRGMKPPQRAIDVLGGNVDRLKLSDIGIEMATPYQASVAEATRGDPGTWARAESRPIPSDATFIGTEADVEARPVREVVLGDNPNVVGDEEPFREGYPPRLYEVADNTYLIADGHHRVVMHNLLETPEFDALVLPFPKDEDEMAMFYGWGTEFANPWHDEQGRFAPKGTGKQAGGPGSAGGDMPGEEPAAEPAAGEGNRTSGADTTALANEVINGMRFDENTQTWVSEKSITIDPVDADDVIKQFANADVAVVDLTAVTVDGAPNMFSQMRENGRPRDQMPQITPDVQPEWWKTLDQDGIGYEQTKVDPASLAATQSELNGKKVGGMITAMQSGKMSLEGDPLLVSNDGHILDGHHRWAATAAMSADCGGCVEIPVIVIDMPMSQLLTYGLAWTDARGIPRAGVADPSKKKQAAGMSPQFFILKGVEKFAAKFPVTNPVKPGTEMPIFATDTADGITDEDTAYLPHGDGSAFSGGETPTEAPAESTAQAAVRHFALIGPVQFANPWHDEIGRFAPKGTGRKFHGGQEIPKIERDENGEIIVSDEAYALAQPIFEEGERLKDEVSEYVSNLVGDATPETYEPGSPPPPQLYGYKFRQKSLEKIAEKIERVVEEDNFTRERAAEDIKDALRYTIHYDADQFGPGTQALLDKLAEDNAYVNVKNTWPPESGNAYKGVNVNVVRHDGFVYEIQFHTPRSQEVKDQMHEMYEEARVLPRGNARRAELEAEMTRMSNELEVPTGAYEISTPAGQTLTDEIRRRLKLAAAAIRHWRLRR